MKRNLPRVAGLLLLSALAALAPTARVAAATTGTATFSVTFSDPSGNYPRRVDAFWVTDDAGNFIQTVRKDAATRQGYLYQWASKRGTWTAVDGFSGATIATWGTFSATWDSKGTNEVVVPDGYYKFYVEMTDRNGQGWWTTNGLRFYKGSTNVIQTYPDIPYLTGMVVSYAPSYASNIAVTGLSPSAAIQNTTVPLAATVRNLTSTPESFLLTLSNQTSASLIGTQVVTAMAGNTTSNFFFDWNTGGLALGNYSLRATAHSLSAETNTTDSVFDRTVNVIRLGDTYSLIPSGSVWKYLDNGTDQGTAWKETNFNDSAWASGAAQLGYGDGDEATVVSYGPASTNKYITTYFRRSFYLPDTSWITNLAARIIRDDGIVVYLNGIEVFRSNMPGGVVGYTTTASSAEDTAIENNFHTNALPTRLLVPGTNVLAVEIHQNVGTSSDLSFELELIANTGIIRTSDPLPPPWVNLDVGGPGLAGSASYVTNNPVWLVQSGGGDIYGTGDKCHFVYDSVLGNCEIRARVAAMGNSSNWAKAGVMIRDTLLSNSKSALMALTPVNGTEYVYRTNAGATATPASQSGPTAPYWVRLVRSGSTVTGYTSPEGSNWAQVFSTSISLSNRVLVGLAVASVSTNKACLAAFDSVSGLSTAASHADIGSPAMAGSFLLETNPPSFLVQGSGLDIWNLADQFHYVFQPVTGNCTLQARVVSMANTDPWAKSGVMLRETLRTDSMQVNMSMTPGHGASMEWRSVTGALSSAGVESTDPTPYWVRLVRSGNDFTGYKSSNGVDWVQVHSTNIDMAATIYAGIVSCSHDNSLTSLAAFDAVNFVPVVNAVTALNGDLFNWGDSIVLHADAADHDGRVALVNYYDQGGNLIGAASVSPYAFVWSNAPPGMNYVSARAVDDQGVWSEPATRALFVAEPDTHVTFYPEFLSSNGLILKGVAGTSNNLLRLTPPAGGVSGAWLANQPVVTNGFDCVFQFRITEQTGQGADGFAFALAGLPSPRLGGVADGLGYNGLTNSLAVEFDTYDGSSSTYNELAVHSRGPLANSSGEDGTLATTTNFPYVSDGAVHTVRILYQPGLLQVFVDDLNAAKLGLPLNLSTWLDLDVGRAWVGFTAATGADKERHDILNWAFVTPNLHPVVSLAAPADGSVFTVPANVTLSATATDPDGTVQRVDFFANGALLGTATNSPWECSWNHAPAGHYKLTVVATDDLGGATTSDLVRIVVNTPPVAVCQNMTVLAGTKCTAETVVDGGSFDPDGDIITLTQNPPGPYSFGDTLVTLTVTDSSGASNSCTATVIVLDTAPPEITCPANMVVNPADGTNASEVTFRVTATDNCDSSPAIICLPPSGSTFHVGTTTVQCTATDSADNTNACSFTVRVNARPLVSLVAPTNGSTFLVGQSINLLADASDPDGDGVSGVDFLEGTSLLGTANSGYTFVWSNAPAGTWSPTARASDGLGASVVCSPVGITVLAQSPTAYGPVTSSNFNRQTGLYLQSVRISNPTPTVFDALRLWVQLDTNSLAHNVRLWNATGTSNGVPFVLYNQPLVAGQSVDLTLEYYIPDRRTMPNPAFIVEVIPSPPAVDPEGTVVAVRQVLWLENGWVRVDFTTLSNRTYYVQYSADMTTWRTALPAITGTGRDMQWLDSGPPKTESPPQAINSRFYRLILLP